MLMILITDRCINYKPFIVIKVERAAESCATSMAGVLPAETVIRVLNPIIKTGDYPVNQAAIKMMSRVAGHEYNKETVISYLGDIMPGLLKVNLMRLRKFYDRN